MTADDSTDGTDEECFSTRMRTTSGPSMTGEPEMGTYDLAALESVYGPVPITETTFHQDAESFERYRNAARTDALGGARVHVTNDGDALLCRVRDGLDGWDVVGGGRESGETPTETACREVREEVGLDVTLTDAVRANLLTFVHEGEAITGLWVYFRGTSETRALSVQDRELHEARWVPPGAVPSALNEQVEPVVQAWVDDAEDA